MYLRKIVWWQFFPFNSFCRANSTVLLHLPTGPYERMVHEARTTFCEEMVSANIIFFPSDWEKKEERNGLPICGPSREFHYEILGASI